MAVLPLALPHSDAPTRAKGLPPVFSTESVEGHKEIIKLLWRTKTCWESLASFMTARSSCRGTGTWCRSLGDQIADAVYSLAA
jgi:hypothetical protein